MNMGYAYVACTVHSPESMGRTLGRSLSFPCILFSRIWLSSSPDSWASKSLEQFMGLQVLFLGWNNYMEGLNPLWLCFPFRMICIGPNVRSWCNLVVNYAPIVQSMTFVGCMFLSWRRMGCRESSNMFDAPCSKEQHSLVMCYWVSHTIFSKLCCAGWD